MITINLALDLSHRRAEMGYWIGRPEGHQKQHILKNNQFMDLIEYGLLRSDYEKI